MLFKEKASKVFPNAVWTGGGPIHASISRAGFLNVPFSKPRVIIKALLEGHFPSYIERCIIKNCPDMEWLYSGSEFEDLLMLDYYRQLQGQPTVKTDQRLQNPSTLNYFHRISLIESQNMVGGVRVWLMPYGKASIQIGFRFRLQAMEEAAVKTRSKSRVKVIEMEEGTAEVHEFAASAEVAEVEEFEKELVFEKFLLA